MALLETQHLAKRYRARQVVADVSLTVERGEVVGLLGPNGAGKTTCFYMVVGLIKADNGVIRLDDRDITRLPMHARAKAGLAYLPQEPSVFRKLTVAENILAILELRGIKRNKRGAALEHLLEELNIGHVRDTLGLALSGGERRRVEIARALAIEPNLMLLDEPFAGVDPISVLDVQRIIVQLKEAGIGVLITDHNVRETLGICDRAYILNEGQVIKQGDADTILSDARVRQVYLGEHFRL